MLSTPRLLLAAGCLVLLASCGRLSDAERKVVGTWQHTGMDFTAYTIFRPDRSMIILSDGDEPLNPRLPPMAIGTWRVEQDELVVEVQPVFDPGPGRTPPPKEVGREKVLEFRDDRLVLEKPLPPYVRVK